MERSRKRKANKDISYLQKSKKIKEDLTKKEYACFLHDNDKGICSLYDCSGIRFRSEDKEKKENKEYLI